MSTNKNHNSRQQKYEAMQEGWSCLMLCILNGVTLKYQEVKNRYCGAFMKLTGMSWRESSCKVFFDTVKESESSKVASWKVHLVEKDDGNTFMSTLFTGFEFIEDGATDLNSSIILLHTTSHVHLKSFKLLVFSRCFTHY